ncbi:L-seryl-tRNA(Sec) selenium transferase, partial [bacterium]|nr:L-seryl-tRNA(Sec) selenium transferase [bacterium]
MNKLLRKLPQVETVLLQDSLAEVLGTYRRDVTKRLIQQEISLLRRELASGGGNQAPDAAGVAKLVTERLAQLSGSVIKPVINATGVLLHTNLGRAVLTPAAQAALNEVAGAYSNLEYDLEQGKRSSRDAGLEPLLIALTGCESATVVNNNAGAVYLALRTLAAGGEVVTSRGELVEIGGSFRVPDVVRASGCTLVEVGATNRTRLADYEEALTPNTRLILKTHTSNYSIQGFVEEVLL